MVEAWSDKDIKEGSTFTSRKIIDGLLNKLQDQKKKRFIPLKKSGSGLEVYSENPRVIVNELTTYKAAIWYSLYDNYLINVLTNDQEAHTILDILKTFFHRETLPTSPIIKTSDEHAPKYKIHGEDTRVYSLYAGANVASFLSITSEEDFYSLFRFPLYSKQKIKKFQSLGFEIAAQIPQPTYSGELSDCIAYHEMANSLKIQIETLYPLDHAVKKSVMEFELFAKLFTLLCILQLLGIIHGHPHPGNFVVSWSVPLLHQKEQEQELVHPQSLSTDIEQLIEAYPQAHLYPYLIDFDRTLFTSRRRPDLYNTIKLQETLHHDPNQMHQVTALQLLEIHQINPQFIEDTLTGKNKLFQQVILKCRRTTLEGRLSFQDLDVITAPIRTHTSTGFPEVHTKGLLRALLPPLMRDPKYIRTLKVWYAFLNQHSISEEFRSYVIDIIVQDDEAKRSKEDTLAWLNELTLDEDN